MKRSFVLYILLLCIFIDLFAQRTIVITGMVVKSDGLPIQNVAVLAKMEKVTGSPTNEKGLYFLR